MLQRLKKRFAAVLEPTCSLSASLLDNCGHKAFS